MSIRTNHTAVIRDWEGLIMRSTEGFQGSVSVTLWQWGVFTSESNRTFNTPGGLLNAKYGLWVITCHCDLINHNKYTTLTLACNVQSGGGCVYRSKLIEATCSILSQTYIFYEKKSYLYKSRRVGKIIILTSIRIKLKWAYYYQKYSITRDKEGCFMRTA